MVETINKQIRVTRQLLQELGRDPTPEEIAKTYDFAFSTSTGRRTLEEAMAAASDDLYFTAVNAARLFQHGTRS